jgi:hypothetical protein
MNDVVMKDVMVTSHHAARARGRGSIPGGFFRLLDLRDGILECSVKKLNEGPDHGRLMLIWNEQAQRSETDWLFKM